MSQQSNTLWILDMECYQIDGELFPLEICLLNVDDVKQYFIYYVKYSNNYFNNLVIKYQFNRHGLKWKDGDETLYSTVFKLKQIISHNDATIYVKGDQKQKLVIKWFSDRRRHVDIIDIGVNAPSINNLKTQCLSQTCDRHISNLEYFCAKRKCYQLLPYVKIPPMDVKNDERQVKVNTTVENQTQTEHANYVNTKNVEDAINNLEFIIILLKNFININNLS